MLVFHNLVCNVSWPTKFSTIDTIQPFTATPIICFWHSFHELSGLNVYVLGTVNKCYFVAQPPRKFLVL